MLTERRARILSLVAEWYITTVHPVPSAQVAEHLGVSSATVRNEFSALEEEGYLQQPHTSAGRIPTSRGFSVYARSFLPPRGPGPQQRRLIRERLAHRHGDDLLEAITGVAAELSGYAVVVRLPADASLRAVEVHLSALSSGRLLAVVVLENGLIRQLMVELDPAPTERVVDDAESSLRQLSVPVGEVPRALETMARHEEPELARTLRAVARAWPALAVPRLFSQGLRNLLSEPESRDPEFMRLVVEQVESPDQGVLEGGLTLSLDDATARIGARLDLGGGSAALTVLGPARMRYAAALGVAQGVAEAVATPQGAALN